MAKTTETASLPQQPDILALTTQIVAAHVGRNQLPLGDLPKLIGEVYRSLQGLGSGQAPAEARPEPVVPIKKSVTPEYIVCLEDGRKLKMLKRHLMAAYGMTPAQYRERWDLPADYPMVAPAYAKHRSKLAKDIGLGKSRSRGRG
jgi:predicted transcriptional regulator